MNRREFLVESSLSSMAAGLGATGLFGRPAPAAQNRAVVIEYIRKNIPQIQVPPYRGVRYDALVPATLDLAERSRLAAEGVLTRQTDPQHDYETFQQANFSDPPIMYHSFHDFNGCQPKYLETLPLLRSISGTEGNLEVDQRLFEVLLHMIGEDGLVYVPVMGRPWATFDDWKSVLRGPNLPPRDVRHIFSLYPNGRALLALCTWHMRDPENAYTKKMLDSMVQGLSSIAVEVDEFVYFPFELIYRTPTEILAAGGAYGGEASAPVPLKQGLASAPRQDIRIIPGSCTDAGSSLQGLARYLRMSGDERAGALAAKLARYVRQAYEEDGRFKWVHTHLNCMGLISLLDYAHIVGDRELKELTRRGYEFARSNGLPLIGFFPEALNLDGTKRPEGTSESCAVAHVTVLAIKLSEYGVADYWEDVDRYVRNHFAEAQLRRTDWIYRIHNLPEQLQQPIIGIFHPHEVKELTNVPGFMVKDGVAERILGAFATTASINDWDPPQVRPGGMGVSSCCTANGARAIYFAWRAILSHTSGELRVNLLLNRASSWVDVNSHLPYTGRVDIHVKEANRLKVRIPEWVDTHAVKLRVNGEDRRFGWEGRYLDIGQVEKKQEVTIEFPMEERTVTVDVPFGGIPKVTLVLKGNDVVEIDPRGVNYPLYQRDYYRQGSTLWKNVSRFEPAEIFEI